MKAWLTGVRFHFILQPPAFILLLRGPNAAVTTSSNVSRHGETLSAPFNSSLNVANAVVSTWQPRGDTAAGSSPATAACKRPENSQRFLSPPFLKG